MVVRCYTAQYFIDEHFKSVPDAVLLEEDGKILDVGTRAEIEIPDGCQCIDLGNSVISPGLINAHCHLELTHIAGQFENPHNFTKWLYNIRESRNHSTVEDLDASIRKGLQLSVEGGVTTIADLRNFTEDTSQFLEHPIRKVFMREVIGFNPEDAEELAAKHAEDVKSMESNRLLTIGIAPHSPYAISPKLYQLLYNICQENNIVFHTHLSEHEGEFEFIQHGTGMFKDLLTSFGRWDRSWKGFGDITPIAYLDRLGVLENSMAVHINYAKPQDPEILARNKTNVVYCPRSADYFDHENYPLETFLAAGLNVCVGTDSLASNISLSLLDDLHFVHEKYPKIELDEILRMHTINGAKALRLDSKIGMLKKGFEADFTAIAYAQDQQDGLKNIYQADSTVCRTVVAGNTLYQS